MPQRPVPPDPVPGESPARDVGVPAGRACGEGEFPDEGEEYLDPDSCLPDPAEEEAYDPAWCEQVTADRAAGEAREAELGLLAASAAAEAERRGPGMPGSARTVSGEYAGRAALFARGMLGDTMPGGLELAWLADEAAGPDDSFDSASDDEVVGLVCAWDRVEAHAAARKLAAVAEFIRRRPAPGCPLRGPARMPEAEDEFAAGELAAVLGTGRRDAEAMLGLAHDLAVKLPGTAAALREGTLSMAKAGIIAWAAALLDPAEARAAEALVLDRAARLTPGGLRAAITRAVMQVAADKARQRREQAARLARVERWPEQSGNAGLAGRELPPAAVLAADQRVAWWARQLRKVGVEGDMDQLRARAFLDLLLGTDSRPRPDTDSRPRPDTDSRPRPDTDSRPRPDTAVGRDPDARDSQARTDDAAGPPAGSLPAGFAGRINLTVPLSTLLGLADRPGEIPGIGPVDPWLARDLASAAAGNPNTTWCVTVTDQHGHAIGHGCARPEPRNQARERDKPGRPDGRDPPPGGSGNRDGPRFAFTASGQPGPPGGYGTWRLATGAGRPLQIALDPIAIDECDHRFAAWGHDPGVKLRHLTEIRHATCTGPGCRRPAARCDFEHNIPYEAGGRSCLCNGNPECRHDHRLKQHPRWKAEQVTPGTIRWTTPTGRQFTTEPTRHPI